MIETTGLEVSLQNQPPQGPTVRLAQVHFDHRDPGNPKNKTSVRFLGTFPRPVNERKYSEDPGTGRYYERDRDLGQTFTVPAHLPAFRLTAITLRIGPATDAVGEGASKVPVALQFLTVSGARDIRTISGAPAKSAPPHDDRSDYDVPGEIYTPLWVVTGDPIQGDLPPGEAPRDTPWLRWKLPDDAPVLQPSHHYAFLVMFREAASGCELALANKYHHPSPPPFEGHGIRREGSIERPYDHLVQVFNGESTDSSASALLPDWEERLNQQPGTWGRPDVDTHRMLTMFIEGV